MTLDAFCHGLTIICAIAAVLAVSWVFAAEYRKRRVANLLWADFCRQNGWEFAPYRISWRGPAFPSARGSWRGREFVMSVGRSLPMVQLLGVKTSSCNFGFMSRSELKKLIRHFSFSYSDSGDADGRYGVTASSQALAASILGHGELHGRMRQLVDQGCGLLGFNEDGACSAQIDWHQAPPAEMQPVLDLLCDLADATEQAVANSQGSANST